LELLSSLGRYDGLDQQNKRVDRVSKSVQAEELPVVRSEADLIDGLKHGRAIS
jgi:hypothetical protein